MAVPNIFANVTTTIPLSQLDTNFATAITLGNTAVYLGNTTTALGNLTLNNVTIASGTASGNLSTGNVTVSGTLGVTGATTLSSTLAAGNTTITGTLSATGILAVGTASSNVTPATFNSTNALGGAIQLLNSGVAKTFLGASAAISGVGVLGDTDLYSAGKLRLFGDGQATNYATVSSTGLAVTGTLSASDTITSTKNGELFSKTGGTVNSQFFHIQNNNNTYIGVENSTGGAIFTGSTAYAAVWGSASNYPAQIFSNNTLVASFASGATTITGTLSCTGAMTFQNAAATAQGNQLATFFGNGASAESLHVYRSDSYSPNGANTVVTVGKDATTGRSISSTGTNNASGADYAEYERNNGLAITKGSIVGFQSDGTLTLTFSEAVRFGVKSTNPSYVGGDTWGSEDAVGERPAAPDEYATDEEKAQYATDIEAFKDRLEAARATVDRIAYSGKVPCNVTGATPGDYIIAADEGGAIAGKAIANPTFEQYRNAVGRVNKILSDGRAEIAVIVH
jgi:hypothetical protein